MAVSIQLRLQDIEQQVAAAVKQVIDDTSCSAALRAVVEELQVKTHKAAQEIKGADERSIRDHIIEAEQASDSAKKAAQAEETIQEETRRAVLAAHASLSALKADLDAL